MKLLALAVVGFLTLLPVSVKSSALRLEKPEWEWTSEPIELAGSKWKRLNDSVDEFQAKNLAEACRMQFVERWLRVDDGQILAVWARNQGCMSGSAASVFLFRLDHNGRAIARLRVSNGESYLRDVADLRPLIEFSRSTSVSPERPFFFPRLAFGTLIFWQSH